MNSNSIYPNSKQNHNNMITPITPGTRNTNDLDFTGPPTPLTANNNNNSINDHNENLLISPISAPYANNDTIPSTLKYDGTPETNPIIAPAAEHSKIIDTSSFFNQNNNSTPISENFNNQNNISNLTSSTPDIDNDDNISEISSAISEEEEEATDYKKGGYHPIQVGDVFDSGRYIALRKLGWGHFSTVWLCLDTERKRIGAMKIVKSAQHYVETALDEIKLLDKVVTSNPEDPARKFIVELYDWFTHKGPNGIHICMVFEVLGPNLLTLIRQYKLRGIPTPVVKRIAKQVLYGLDYLHRQCGIIHTDLKPENILICINMKDTMRYLDIDIERVLDRFEKIARAHGGANRVTNIPEGILMAPPSLPKCVQKLVSKPFSYDDDILSKSSSICSNNNNNNNKDDNLANIPHAAPAVGFSERSESKVSSTTSSELDTISLERNMSGISISQNNSNIVSPRPLHAANNENNKTITNNREVSSPISSIQNDINSINSSPSLSLSSESIQSFDSQISTNTIKTANPTSSIEVSPESLIEKTFNKSSPKSPLNDKSISISSNNNNNIHQQALLNSTIASTHTQLLELEKDDISSNYPRNTLPKLMVGGELQSGGRLSTTLSPVSATYSTGSSKITNSRTEEEIKFNEELKQNKKLENDKRILVKIADLGNACWTDHHFTQDIQTRQYRSPEVIIGCSYHTSTDIWSLGCIVFELLTGDYLFDPQENGKYTKDDDHLAQIIELQGDFPKSFALSGQWSSEIFNRHGQLRRITKLRYWKLEDVLIDKYRYSKTDAKELAEFLLPMIEIVPTKRATAQQMLSSPWLEDVQIDINEFENPVHIHKGFPSRKSTKK